MDIFDDILNVSPRDKFFQMLRHANAGAVEKVMQNLIKEQIILRDFLENKGLTGAEFEEFKLQHGIELEERMNDYFIGLTAEILGNEG